MRILQKAKQKVKNILGIKERSKGRIVDKEINEGFNKIFMREATGKMLEKEMDEMMQVTEVFDQEKRKITKIPYELQPSTTNTDAETINMTEGGEVEIEIMISKKDQKKLMKFLTTGMNNKRKIAGIPMIRHKAFEKAEKNRKREERVKSIL